MTQPYITDVSFLKAVSETGHSAFPPDLPVCSVIQERTGGSRLLSVINGYRVAPKADIIFLAESKALFAKLVLSIPGTASDIIFKSFKLIFLDIFFSFVSMYFTIAYRVLYLIYIA